MSGPWEDYAPAAAKSAPAASDGPWADYSAPKAAAKPAAKTPTDPVTYITGLMANVNRGLGIGDEMAAGFATAGDVVTGKTAPGDVVQGFQSNMAKQRQEEDQFRADHRTASNLALGTGNALTAAIPGGKSVQAFAEAPRVVNALRGAVAGGATAAAYGAADRGTAQERLQAASEGATNPLALGLGAVGGALGPAASKARPAKPAPAPTIDQLRAQKNAAYDAVDKSGVTYDPKAFDSFVDDTTAAMQKANISPTRHPKAASMLADIQAMKGQAPSLTQMDQLRQVIRRDVGNSTDPAEQFFGQKMIEQLDGFIDNAGGEGSDIVRKARDLNTRVRKIDTVNDAVDSAQLRAGSTGSGGNVDNATRQNLRRVLEKTKNFTDDEAAALERIVMGSKGQNALRQVGKLSPQGNGLMTALSIGGAAANPLLAIPTAAGAVSKVAADAITQRRVRELVDLIARGGKLGDIQAATKELSQIAKSATGGQAAARLGRAGAVAAQSETGRTRELTVDRSTNPDHLAWRKQQGLN